MTLRPEARGLIVALALALAVQVPMLPGVGLETRDLSGYAPWMTTVSLFAFFPLLTLAIVAIPVAWRRPKASAVLAAVFALGMIPITAVDMFGLAGPRPPTLVLAFELGALATFGLALFEVFRLVGRLRAQKPSVPRRGSRAVAY